MLWLLFTLSLFCCCCCSVHFIEAPSQYNLLSSGNSGTSAMGAITTATTFAATDSDSWQPMSNNWLILHSSGGLQAYDNNRSGINIKQQKQKQQQQLYGHHATGSTPQHNILKPYILTFSKVPPHDASKEGAYAQQVTDSFYTKQRQRLAVNKDNFVATPTTTAGGTKGPPTRQTPQEIGNRELSLDVEITSSLLPSTRLSASPSSSSSPPLIAATASQQQPSSKSSAATVVDEGAQIIQNSDMEQRLDDLLLPYKNIFANVKYFFNVVKNLIGVSEADADIKWPKSKKLQDHNEVSRSASTTTTATLSVGTSRKVKKLKKKLKKFMLPLLLAYKLKFLMLIPLLFGGLTLLVGTTGLAGFFFALFTAVMSLKTSGGDSKSFVVKKIN